MARYIPGNPPADISGLPQYFSDEFAKMSQALETQVQSISFATLYSYPPKYREGTTFKADGTTLDPGSGGGTYQYRSGAWHFLG